MPEASNPRVLRGLTPLLPPNPRVLRVLSSQGVGFQAPAPPSKFQGLAGGQKKVEFLCFRLMFVAFSGLGRTWVLLGVPRGTPWTPLDAHFARVLSANLRYGCTLYTCFISESVLWMLTLHVFHR